MVYKSKKIATCPCGDGDQHSLRTGGICDAMRSGVLTSAEALKQLEEVRGKSKKGSFVEPAAATTDPTGEIIG